MKAYEKYFDYAATSPVSMRVSKLYNDKSEIFFNPNTNYIESIKVSSEIENARISISNFFYDEFQNVIATSSGTQSNNCFIRGYIYQNYENIKHIIVGSVEHNSVLSIFEDDFIKKLLKNVKIDYIDINKHGLYDIEDFKSKISSETNLVCLMLVNNITGSINDLNIIKGEFLSPETVFYSDFTQGIGKINISKKLISCVDAIGFSGHKLGTFKNTGALLFKKPIEIRPLYNGSISQEYGIIPGTQNFLEIVSLSLALNENKFDIVKNEKVAKMMDAFFNILDFYKIDYSFSNDRLMDIPHICSLRINEVKADALRNYLNLKYGYMFSLSSACSDKNALDNVLSRLELTLIEQKNTFRISFSQNQTIENVETFALELVKAVKTLKGVK